MLNLFPYAKKNPGKSGVLHSGMLAHSRKIAIKQDYFTNTNNNVVL